jgi:hypothetical protein
MCDSNMRILYMASPTTPQLKSYGLVSEWTICQRVLPPSSHFHPLTDFPYRPGGGRHRLEPMSARPPEVPYDRGIACFTNDAATLVLVLGAKSSAAESTLTLLSCALHIRDIHTSHCLFFFKFCCILAI